MTAANLVRERSIAIVERRDQSLQPFVELGYHHLIGGFPSPHDEESMTRLATEVKPILERG